MRSPCRPSVYVRLNSSHTRIFLIAFAVLAVLTFLSTSLFSSAARKPRVEDKASAHPSLPTIKAADRLSVALDPSHYMEKKMTPAAMTTAPGTRAVVTNQISGVLGGVAHLR